MVAELLGKEAALFLPSGTMCNQVAFAVHCRAGDEILLHETAHPLLYEAGGAAALIGAVFRPLPGPAGDVHRRAGSAGGAARRSTTCRGRGWSPSSRRRTSWVAPAGRSARSRRCALRRARLGLARHMDGARLMNAVVSSGTPAQAFAAHFDSVWLDLTKGLGAPVGAVLAGSRAFIEEAWVFKQRLGGAMRQAGIIAAAGIYALRHNVDRLAEDHERARRLAGRAGRAAGDRGGCRAGSRPTSSSSTSVAPG